MNMILSLGTILASSCLSGNPDQERLDVARYAFG